MLALRIVLWMLVAPLCFLGFEPTPVFRAPRRNEERQESRRERTRRDWYFPLLRSASADDAVRPTRHDDQFKVVLKFMPRRAAFEACQALGVWPGVRFEQVPRNFSAGCNVFDKVDKVCTIITPEPEYVDDDATRNLGHEVLHCARGAFHD